MTIMVHPRTARRAIILFTISCTLLLSAPSFARAVASESLGQRHSDGTHYCIRATDVALTTRQIQRYQRAGTLHEEIVKRSQALIRTLPDEQVYFGTFEFSDLRTLRLASDIEGTESFRVLLRVDPFDGTRGEITIVVRVTQTSSQMLDSSQSRSFIYRLFPSEAPLFPSERFLATEVAPPLDSRTSPSRP